MKNKNKFYFFGELACAIGELACLIVAIALDQIPVALLALLCCGVCIYFACRAYAGASKKPNISEVDYTASALLASEVAKEQTPSRTALLVTLAAILLFNINIGIMDILPDFIAYFMLAKAFSYASARAPYFAEARTGFIHLGWIALLKIPAIVITTAARTGNTLGYDWNAVMSLVFAVVELIFTIPVVTNIFSGLFRLGERTPANALINPKKCFSPDLIRIFTYALVAAKCVFSAIPDFFRLTKMADDGIHLVYVTAGYPISIAITQFIGIPLGILWLISIIKYVKAIKSEGMFVASLDLMCEGQSFAKVERKRMLSKMRSVMTTLCAASLFSLELRLDDFDGINVIPHFIYGLVLIYAGLRLLKFTPGIRKKGIIIYGTVYTTVATAIMVIETHFLYYYGYEDLATSDIANALYLAVEILSLIELTALIILLIYIARAMGRFIYFHTAIPPTSERYSRADRDYHRSLLRWNYFVMSLGILSAALKCVGVFSRGSVQSVVVQTPNVPTLSFLPSMPWITLVIAIGAIALIGFSIYFFTNMKEEVEMKYNEESL